MTRYQLTRLNLPRCFRKSVCLFLDFHSLKDSIAPSHKVYHDIMNLWRVMGDLMDT